jgi:DNA-binding response OmpR family regulator
MSTPENPTAHGRILVVDDERSLLEVLGAMLAEAGWQVDTAGDGREALGFVDAHRYDVVLSDIDMPGVNGVQLLREIRARDLDVPVLLITGHPRVDTAVEALEHGALRYLQKPVRERDLLTAVEDASRLHRMARLKREALAAIGLEGGLPSDRAGLESRFGRALSSSSRSFARSTARSSATRRSPAPTSPASRTRAPCSRPRSASGACMRSGVWCGTARRRSSRGRPSSRSS